MYNNIILRNFNFSNNFLKLVLNAGSAKKTPLLLTIFNQYNFTTNSEEFFNKFNNLTSFLSKDILLQVILYIPDSFSFNNSFLFYIKAPNSYFLLKKLLILFQNNFKLNSYFFINILDLFKVAILKSLVLSNFQNINFIFYFKFIKNIFFSLKGSLKSIQSLKINNKFLPSKSFFISLYI